MLKLIKFNKELIPQVTAPDTFNRNYDSKDSFVSKNNTDDTSALKNQIFKLKKENLELKKQISGFYSILDNIKNDSVV